MLNDQHNSNNSGWRRFTYVSGTDQGGSSGSEQWHSGDSANSPSAALRRLDQVPVGDRAQIVALNCGESNQRFMGMGLVPGAIVQIVSSTTTGSVILALGHQRLGLGGEIAQQIQVTVIDETSLESPTTSEPMPTMPDNSNQSTVKLRDAAIGSTLRVVGYEPTARDYKRKLLAMGLTPGTELRVNRHAPLGDPTEITVRGFQLSLRKAEADTLIVAPVTGGES